MAANFRGLEPTRYHREVVEYLRGREPELWKWFSSRNAQAEYTEALRVGLLKSCYRLGGASHAELAQVTEEAKGRLGVDVPVTLYQSQEAQGLNAALYFIPGEAHIVFSGNALTLLSRVEVQSIVGHELAHYRLWQCEEESYLIADRVLDAIVSHPGADSSHYQTARRYRLYTEIFADRGSLIATEDLIATISGLVKLQTGLGTVSGESYLEQAEEIFARDEVRTAELSHPEAFIRARALRFWHEQRPELEEELQRIVEHYSSLEELDLLGQQRWTELTRRFLGELLRPVWFQTADTLAHAKLFFPDFLPAKNADESLAQEIVERLRNMPGKFGEYFRYLLLDFCAIDPELERVPAVAAISWSRKLGFELEFEKLLSKELKISAKELKTLRAEADEMQRKAGEGA